MTTPISFSDRAHGCMLAGAYGEALGLPVEFMSLAEIHQNFGPSGIREFSRVHGDAKTIPDNTQLMLATAQGLIDALSTFDDPTDQDILKSVHQAYYQWRGRQRGSELANHCTTSLIELGRSRPLGTLAINEARDAEAICRIAPVGIAFASDPHRAFAIGCDLAHLTHGHPTGYIAAGTFSMIIAFLMQGKSFEFSVQLALGHLQYVENADEVAKAIIYAPYPERKPPPRASFMGFGWMANEALAIALHAVASTKSLEEAIIKAANLDGNSPGAATLTGHLAGTIYGAAEVPKRWTLVLEGG